MKKGLFNLVLALTLVVAGFTGVKETSKAAESDGLSYSWNVTYNGTAFESNYDINAAKIKNAMPGDTITYSVKYINATAESTDFYMNADVVKSLEDTSGAQGGAYSFKIINNEETLFDSETVGGDADEVVGLNQVSGHEGAYFSLGSIPAGGSGVVTITITLDGNSQTNAYMATQANLNIKFGAEPTESAKYSKTETNKVTKVNTITKNVPVSEKRSIVKKILKTLENGTEVVSIDDSDVPLAGGDNAGNPQTGDSILPFAVCGVMFIIGMGLIGCYAVLMLNKKKEVA